MNEYKPDYVSHPGETVAETARSKGLSQKQVASLLRVSPGFVCDLYHGRRDISTRLAIRLEEVSGVTAEFWLTRQMHYDLHLARKEA